MLHSASSDFMVKARYGVGEESAEMRIKYCRFIQFVYAFYDKQKSNTVEQGYSRSQIGYGESNLFE